MHVVNSVQSNLVTICLVLRGPFWLYILMMTEWSQISFQASCRSRRNPERPGKGNQSSHCWLISSLISIQCHFTPTQIWLPRYISLHLLPSFNHSVLGWFDSIHLWHVLRETDLFVSSAQIFFIHSGLDEQDCLFIIQWLIPPPCMPFDSHHGGCFALSLHLTLLHYPSAKHT